MMTEQQSQEETFHGMLEGLYADRITEEDGFGKLREKAWDHFLELGLPNRSTEVYKYIKLRQLFAGNYQLSHSTSLTREQFEEAIYPECKQSCFVFVNGHYSEALSSTDAIPKKVAALPLQEAAKTYGAFLNNHFAKTLKEETDPFAAVNMAIFCDGLFLYIPPACELTVPIQILHVIATEHMPYYIAPRMQVFVGKGAAVDLYQTQKRINGDSYHINMVADFSLEDAAKVRLHQVMMDQQSVRQLDAVRARLKRDSHFTCLNVNSGAAGYRNDYRAVLTGENGEAELDGVWMLAEKKESHVNILIDHQAPHCRSRQLFKGILRDFSRSSFEGKILVRQAAQKTDAFQLNNNLLLSERAHADSKPNLEIFADDVKASHGATVGRLDDEQLFYLKSRGFSDAKAKNLLVYGYCKEIIDRIPIESLRATLKNEAEGFIA